MASEVEIANRAMSKLGEARIISLTDASKPARAMAARFDLLRDAELAAQAWRFAVTRVQLPASVEVPAWGFSTIFNRPADDLRPLMISGAFVDFRAVGVMFQTSGYWTDSYEIISGKIHANMSAPLDYEYVKRETNTAMFDPLFVEALACRLALDAAEELTQSTQKAEAAERQYRRAISEAKRINALYNPPKRKGTGPFMQARFWG